MCSAKRFAGLNGPDETSHKDSPSSSSDLTAKSRIRDAALVAFGKRGLADTSIRGVAEAAGVSPALVIHHFGSKDGLRRACDRYAIDDLWRKTEELDNDDLIGTMTKWLAEPEAYRPTIDYLSRSIVDGGAAGDELFDEVVASTEKMIAEGAAAGIMNLAADSRMQAVLVTAFALVPLLLERQIGRTIGTDGLDAEALQRLTVPTLELLTHGLYSDDTYLEAARAAVEGA